MELKILQWNVWYKESADNIIAALKSFDADIFCLQELTQTSEYNPNIDIPGLIRAELTPWSAFYIAQSWEVDGKIIRNQGNGIFSKFRIIEHYSKSVQISGGHDPHFDDEERIYVESDIDINGKILTLGTTHLSYTDRFKGSSKRGLENQKLIEHIGKERKHYFFSGDLNAPCDSAFIDELPRNTNLRIASPSCSKNTWTTKPFSYNGFEATELTYRLDYAFSSYDIEIVDTKILSTDVSDHLPILTTIKF